MQRGKSADSKTEYRYSNIFLSKLRPVEGKYDCIPGEFDTLEANRGMFSQNSLTATGSL